MKNYVTDKKILYAGLVYLISMVIFVGMRILWSTDLFRNMDSIFSDLIFSGILQILVLTIIPILLWKTLCKQNFKQTCNYFFIKKINPKSILYSILLGVLCYFVIIFVSTFWSYFLSMLGYNAGSGSSSTTTDMPVWLIFVLSIVTTSILPGFGEETLHRGIIMGNARYNGIKRAILLSALMFGLAHMNIGQFGYAFAIGLVLGASVFTSRSILPAIIIHATSNFCSIYFDFASTYDWFGGGIFDFLTNIFTQNWLMGSIFAFIFIMIIFTMIIFCLVRLHAHASEQKFLDFVENLKKATQNTELQENIDFENKNLLFLMYTQAATMDLKNKHIDGRLPPNYLQQVIGKNPLNSILYTEFDDFSPPKSYNYIFHYIAIALMSIVTFMTFLWGIL